MTVPLAPRAAPRPRPRRPPRAPYFLFVGALEPRKAPDVLVDALPPRPGARARGASWSSSATAGWTPTRPGVRRLGRVDDLGALYAGALAVVLPSWLEGFGLPPVEGLAAGAPAIVSDLPVLREVLGDGALYVPPGDAAGARRRAAARGRATPRSARGCSPPAARRSRR